MAQSFNPYAEWLGVQCAAAQPNHYELLRLAPFEPDPDAILTAANMQMAKVRGVRPGEHADDWRRLLDELGAAKRCLTDGIEKSQYDVGLRATGWPTPASANAAGMNAKADSETKARRSPYMEVTTAGASNPLPPQIGGGSSAGGSSAGGGSTSAAAWQPGTNLLPPSARASADAAANKGNAPSHGSAPAAGWIPPPAADKAWTPPSPRAAQSPGSPVAPQNPPAPAMSAPPLPTGSPPQAMPPASVPAVAVAPAPKPKLQFPGETVPVAPAPSVPSPNLPSPIPAFPAPGPMLPAGIPQPGGAFQFLRPFAPLQMPGAIPPNVLPPNAMPPVAMPQQPFAGQFYPGAPLRPGINPQFPPGTPGVPNYFQQPPSAPMPYAPAPVPGGMPGYPQQHGPMPGFAGNYPPQGLPPQPMMPQPMMPQPMMPQPMMPQSMAPQAAPPAAGPSFLDDVLSGPNRGGSSSMDELDFGGSTAAPQPTQAWQPGNFAPPGSIAINPSGFEQAVTPPMQVDYEPSGSESTHPFRHSARPQQGSRTLLIGGALAAILLLTAVLVAVVILKQKDATVAESDKTENRSDDHSIAPPTKTSGTTNTSGQDTAKSKTTGPVKPPRTDRAKTPTGTSTKNPSGTMPPDQPAVKNPVVKTPNKKPAKPSSNPLVIQPTGPDPAMTKSPKPPTIDPVKAARLTKMLAETRQKLAERNQADAGRLIANAKTLAVTPEQIDRVQRMAMLVKYVGEFWGAVRDAMGGLKATDEIDIGSTKAIVVDADAQSLTIRAAGGILHFTIHDMRSGVAVALANRWLDQNKPESKIFIGAFYAIDPKHEEDRSEAKRLWNEAAAAGVSDGSYLLPLLNPEPAAPEMPAGEVESLPPVPDAKAVERAIRKVKDEFDDAIVGATTPTKFGELIQRFFDAADSSDDPLRRYAICVEARDVAAKAGRAKLAVEAIDRIAKDFRVDALDMKAETFTNYPPTTQAGGRELTRVALALAKEAVDAKRISLASRLADLALAAAKVSQGNDLIRQATQKSNEIEALANKKTASDAK